MKLSQNQIPIQKQIMTPVMQQSIEILMLPILDLETAITQQLEENPFLEIDETQLQHERDNPPQDIISSQQKEETPPTETISDDMQILMNNQELPFSHQSFSGDSYEHTPIHSSELTLEEHLLRQIHIDLEDPLKIRIAEMIIGQLNEDGYLTTQCSDIADALKLNTPDIVEDVLSLIQTYEPAGIAARDLKECLILQANAFFNGSMPLIITMIQDHIEHLGRKRYDIIAKTLKISTDQVRDYARIIATLDPRPARNFRPISNSNYIKPDICIYENPSLPEEFLVEIYSKDIPPLRINPIYRKLIKKKDLSVDEKEFLREKLQNAVAFMKSIQQRGSTMKEIGNFILKEQKEFFVNGYSALKPMGLKDVANAIGRNESTVSRAIHQKYIETPLGLFPLKYFFSQGVGDERRGEKSTSNRSIKEEIRGLVQEENKQHPLSDNEIQDLLTKKGISVARRTIGKYRQQLNILPSHLRKI